MIGSVLVQALWKPFQNERRNVSIKVMKCVTGLHVMQIAMVIMIVALCLHAGIAVGFKVCTVTV